jgi:hypothetical protein
MLQCSIYIAWYERVRPQIGRTSNINRTDEREPFNAAPDLVSGATRDDQSGK